jgi:predicted metal-dependent HD superfamily phosphohydrolase
MYNLLHATWQSVASKYSDTAFLTEGTLVAIHKAYSHKKRHYHNLTHIENLLTAFHQYDTYLKDADVVLFSIYFHDSIYNVLKSDNEARSAEKAIAFLSKTNFPPFAAQKVATFINATKTHSNSPNDPDLDFFLDFDLQILGASPENYRIYTEQIRQEYSIYPDFIYNAGRKKVLMHFLDLPFIFKTEVFWEKYEDVARENLIMEMRCLK